MSRKFYMPEKEILDGYSDKEYLAYTIAFHAAPTIMRKKAASLITFKNADRPLKDIWLREQGPDKAYFAMKYYCLCQRPSSVTVLFYHEDLLINCLRKKDRLQFLGDYGYGSDMTLGQHLLYLGQRYEAGGCPHEIGIFLDYPLHDVKAFMDPEPQQHIFTGYWKVYGQAEAAREKFREFDMSKYLVLAGLVQGKLRQQVQMALG